MVSGKRIKKGDTVVVTSGAQSGRSGKVLEVIPTSGRAIVEGVNLVKKTLRKSQDNPQGGITEKESPMAVSNLMLQCPTCKKGVRINHARDGEKRIRKCRSCGHVFEN